MGMGGGGGDAQAYDQFRNEFEMIEKLANSSDLQILPPDGNAAVVSLSS